MTSAAGAGIIGAPAAGRSAPLGWLWDVVAFQRLLISLLGFEAVLDLIRRSADVDERLLEAASEAAPASQELFDEYGSQAAAMLSSMNQIANELCFICCRLRRRFGPTSDEDLCRLSDGLWNGRADCARDREQFRRAVEASAGRPAVSTP